MMRLQHIQHFRLSLIIVSCLKCYFILVKKSLPRLEAQFEYWSWWSVLTLMLELLSIPASHKALCRSWTNEWIRHVSTALACPAFPAVSVNGIYYAFSVSLDYAATFTGDRKKARKKACLGKRESRPTIRMQPLPQGGEGNLSLSCIYRARK